MDIRRRRWEHFPTRQDQIVIASSAPSSAGARRRAAEGGSGAAIAVGVGPAGQADLTALPLRFRRTDAPQLPATTPQDYRARFSPLNVAFCEGIPSPVRAEND